MKALAASGVPPTGVMFMPRRCSAVSGSASTALMPPLSLAMIAAGAFGGAASACQVSERKPLTPASSIVGTSGTEASRLGVVTASILILFGRYCSRTESSWKNSMSICPAMRSFTAWAVPRYGTCTSLVPVTRANNSREVGRGTDALRAEIDLARIRFGIGNELRNRARGEIEAHHERVRNRDHDCQRLEGSRVEIELLVEHDIRGQRRRLRREQGVPVGLRLRDRL